MNAKLSTHAPSQVPRADGRAAARIQVRSARTRLLRDLVRHGLYEVDPSDVAEAMLRRLRQSSDA